jgi:hypothetical protein
MAFLLNQQATGLCSHGGSATPILGNPRVKVGGAAVLTVSTQFAVSGCPNVVGTAPFPCVLATFAQGAARVKVMGQPVLLDSASAQNVPTGATLTIINPQARVKGT